MMAQANRQRAKGLKTVLKWLALLMLLTSLHAFAQSTNSVTYVYTDPQGTPLAEADASGNITATFEYAPYGTFAPTGTSSPGVDPKGPGYTGHVNDPETNLVYMQARYYDPATGRFLSVDPDVPNPGDQSNFNRYVYGDNDPVGHIDPTGDYAQGLTPQQVDCEIYGGGSNCGTKASSGKSSNNTASGSGNSSTSGWQWLVISATNALCQGGIQGACDEGPINAQPLVPGSEQDENWSVAGSLIGQATLIPLFGSDEEVAVPGATRVSFKGRFTKIGASEIYVDASMSEAIKNLSTNGYVKNVSQDGKVVVMSNGKQTYTFYQKSTGGGIRGGATGFPSASLQIVGGRSPITKLRFTGP
jgi:RHS repeat-associated protein